MDKIIEMQNITKQFRNNTALDNVNLSINKGEIVGLVGRNGAGKTTIMKLLIGVLKPTKGSIALYGHSENLSHYRENIGTLIESPEFFPYLSAHDNLEYFRRERGITDKSVVDEAIKLAGIDIAGNKKFSQYSLGMKQRLGMALAIMGRPEILILDEPMNGIDPIAILEIREMLLNLNRTYNTTILISSHILPELANTISRVVFVDNGHILEDISMEGLNAKCGNYLEIRVNDTAAAATLIEQQLGYKDYKVMPGNRIHLFEGLDEYKKVTNVLLNSDLDIASVNRETLELEDYYAQLLGGGQHNA